MTETVIRVEGLGKRYRIRHATTPRYRSLREDLAAGIGRLMRRGRSDAGEAPEPSGEEDFWALRGVTFEVKQGEVIGIIGRNGAGKSTLLKILSRITEPTEGRVRIAGRVASLLEVGTGFHPELTGRENIYLNGVILGMTRAEVRKRFDEIVAFAEVERFLDTPVKHYSSGMYVRLAFSVAAHLDPEILIVDEVLAVGDAEFQKKCLGKLRNVSAGGRTVLFVSHHMAAIQNLCQHGLLLSLGRVIQMGPVSEVVRGYMGMQLMLEPAQTHLRHIAEVRAGDSDARWCHLFFGETLVIRVRLTKLPSEPSGLALTINDAQGRRLSLFSTNPHDGVVLPKGGGTEVTFIMDFCAYAPGEYRVDIALTEPDVRVIEEAVTAVRFEVLPATRGGTLAYGAPYGEFFPPHQWRITGS